MYFSKFPTISYDVKGDGQLFTMTNLMRRVKFTEIAKNNLGLNWMDDYVNKVTKGGIEKVLL